MNLNEFILNIIWLYGFNTQTLFFFYKIVTPTSAIAGAGLAKDVALLTDGRFSGGSHVRIPFFFVTSLS